MMQLFRGASPLAVLVMLNSGIATEATATLGKTADSLESVRQALHAERQAPTPAANYTVHEMTTDGFTLREYATKDGVIFAAAWQGVSYPDLTTILGSYFDEFKQAQPQLSRAHGRSPRGEVRSSNLVVIKGGHMRAWHGKAYIINLLPEGVTADDIH